MGFELFGLAKAEFRFKLNNFTKIKRGKNRDFVFFSVHPFFRLIRFHFKRVILYLIWNLSFLKTSAYFRWGSIDTKRPQNEKAEFHGILWTNLKVHSLIPLEIYLAATRISLTFVSALKIRTCLFFKTGFYKEF